MKYRRRRKRIKRFFDKYGIGKRIAAALADPRGRQGRQWPFPVLVNALVLGVMTGRYTLKDVERMTERCGPRVPDSTMSDLLHRLDPTPLRGLIVEQVRELHRRKALRPEALPFGVLAIDNKNAWDGDHEGDVECQRREGRWHQRCLRFVLVSARSRPCLGQTIVPKGTNDHGAFPTAWQQLREDYRGTDLYRLVTVDAGFTYKRDLALVDGDGCGYLANVKRNQAHMLAELRRLFRLHNPPRVASSGEEPVKGGRIRRELFRLGQDVLQIENWPHLRQAVLVRQTTRLRSGVEKVIERFYITNMPWNLLLPVQLLRVVRMHWGIENNCNRTLDMDWGEDTHAWASNAKCLPDSAPLRVMAELRLLAYNFVGWLKYVHLRVEPTWRELLDALCSVMTSVPSTLEIEVAFALGEGPLPA